MKADRIKQVVAEAWRNFPKSRVVNTQDFCTIAENAIEQATKEERAATIEEVAKDLIAYIESGDKGAPGHEYELLLQDIRNFANELRNREVK